MHATPSSHPSPSPAAGPATPALRLLDVPTAVLGRMASRLARPDDRASLLACCRALLAASLEHSGDWWGSIRITVPPRGSNEYDLAPGAGARLAALTAWLAARRPAVRELHVALPFQSETATCARVRAVVGSSRARYFDEISDLPPGVSLPLPALPSLVDLSLSSQDARAALPAICQHTALTALELRQCDVGALPPGLSGLTALRWLSLPLNRGLFLDWDLLPALVSLTSLDLLGCFLRAVGAGIGTCTQLCSLVLRGNGDGYWARPLEGVERLSGLGILTALHLGNNRLRQLPPALSALGALVHLSIRNNDIDLRDAPLLRVLGALPALATVDAAGRMGGCGPGVLAALAPRVREHADDLYFDMMQLDEMY
eukprot:scaffold8.g1670.t1